MRLLWHNVYIKSSKSGQWQYFSSQYLPKENGFINFFFMKFSYLIFQGNVRKSVWKISTLNTGAKGLRRRTFEKQCFLSCLNQRTKITLSLLFIINVTLIGPLEKKQPFITTIFHSIYIQRKKYSILQGKYKYTFTSILLIK